MIPTYKGIRISLGSINLKEIPILIEKIKRIMKFVKLDIKQRIDPFYFSLEEYLLEKMNNIFLFGMSLTVLLLGKINYYTVKFI